MSVLPMKRAAICALKKDRKAVLELLQRQGVVQVENPECSPDDPIFARTDKSADAALFRKYAQSAQDALAILNREAPQKKGLLASLAGRERLSVDEFEALVAKRDEIQTVGRAIQALDREKAENEAAMPKLQSQIVALEPWLGYDLPLDFKGTEKAAAFAGSLPNEVPLETVYAQLGSFADRCHVEIISQAQIQTCLFAVCEKSCAEEVSDALRKMGFVKAPDTDVNPAEETKRLQDQLVRLQQRNLDIQNAIRACADRRQELEFLVDYFAMRAEKYEVLGTLPQSRRTFLLQGYVPAERADTLKELLESRFDISVELADPGPDEDVPVVLRNNPVARPVESVVESYSMPGRGEIDPSSLVALFYYVLFGIMLSDAAYGLIMVIVCGLLVRKYKNMEQGTKNLLSLFFYCGISTTVFGFLFGSFFGDSVNIIATTFFNRPDISLPAIWMAPLNSPMKMLTFCFAVGILHLFVGLGAKFYMLWRDHKYLDAIYDVVFWYMLVGGCIVLLLTVPMFTSMLTIQNTLPASVGNVAKIVALIGAVGIVLTGGRDSKNWFKRILKGIYAVYGISGYLSDILSYSRLLALGLATGVIATVFNKMGSMMGGNFFGAVMFLIVFLIGHALNMAINILGSYVHTNRLTFVEFFGKFYSGGGRKFQPFAVHTKYYKFKEEIKS
jgi:V/A-type H+-transporting ATPase subunit I